MAIVDVSQLTMNPLEVQEASKIIFERVYDNPLLTEIHDVETGVQMKTQIVFANRINRVLGKLSEGCTPNEEEGFTMSQKYWDPAREDFRIEHCQADLPVLLKLFKKAQKMNPDFYNVVDSEEFGVLVAALEDAMAESIFIKAWFADVNASTAPGGSFTPGTDIARFNTFDGLFKQIFAEIPTTATNYVKIDANAGANYTAQELPADAALAIFRKMFNKADKRLNKDTEAELLVTATLFDNYVDTLETKTIANGYLERTEGGTVTAMYRGVRLVMVDIWDRTIDQYQDNGTKLNLPHRAVLTTKSNIPIGTLSEEDLAKLNIFYNEYTKTNVIDAVYTLDAKHLQNYLTVAAY
jgi:hypothetical protein